MDNNQVKSGKEILEDFFENIQSIENVDKSLAQSLTNLYAQGKLSDKNIINELFELRIKDGNKD
jgi:hypothetical protein